MIKHVVEIRFKSKPYTWPRTITLEADSEKEVNKLLEWQLDDLEAAGVYRILHTQYYTREVKDGS